MQIDFRSYGSSDSFIFDSFAGNTQRTPVVDWRGRWRGWGSDIPFTYRSPCSEQSNVTHGNYRWPLNYNVLEVVVDEEEWRERGSGEREGGGGRGRERWLGKGGGRGRAGEMRRTSWLVEAVENEEEEEDERRKMRRTRWRRGRSPRGAGGWWGVDKGRGGNGGGRGEQLLWRSSLSTHSKLRSYEGTSTFRTSKIFLCFTYQSRNLSFLVVSGQRAQISSGGLGMLHNPVEACCLDAMPIYILQIRLLSKSYAPLLYKLLELSHCHVRQIYGSSHKMI